MSGLVGYGSSDEEDDIQPEKPAKIAKVEASSAIADRKLQESKASYEYNRASTQIDVLQAPHIPQQPARIEQQPAEQATPPLNDTTHSALFGPSVTQSQDDEATATSAPSSPYTHERQRIQNLTLPTVPSFSIPDSPSPPPSTSEEAATLAATTKKVTRFLDLKAQGTHFNARLQNSSSLRNPSLLLKLLDFAGISREESHASSLSVEAGRVPASWPEECYVENLAKVNERKEKKRKAEREKVDFVPPATVTAGSKSGGSSATGTPKSSGGGQRKSRFDQR